MRKSTRTLIALTAAMSFTAAACGSDDETPVDNTVVVDDSIVDDAEDVVDSIVDDAEDVVDSVMDDVTEDEAPTTEG